MRQLFGTQDCVSPWGLQVGPLAGLMRGFELCLPIYHFNVKVVADLYVSFVLSVKYFDWKGCKWYMQGRVTAGHSLSLR